MFNRIKMTIAIGALGLFAGAMLLNQGQAQARIADYDVSTTPMFQLQNPDASMVEGLPEVADSASVLVRTDEGITMTVGTSGLEPGSAYTAWWVIFNNPEDCSYPGCGHDDLAIFGGDPDVNSSVLYASGNVVGSSGDGNFGAHLATGDTPGQVLFGPALTDPMGSEVHIVLRNHGPEIPELAYEQMTTFGGGCNNTPPSLGAAGGFFCFDPQAVAHMPVVDPFLQEDDD